MIVVVDYGRGNLFSLSQALHHVGAEFEVTCDARSIESADKIILPGVGAFGDCMNGLKSRDLVGPLLAAVGRGIPLLGICVGCQILLEAGEEFGHQIGLGLIPGTVRRLPDPRKDDDDAIRIPNVGWRQLTIVKVGPLFAGVNEGTMMYFVHSFAPVPARQQDVAASIEVNGRQTAIAIQSGHTYGVQFHPEKSGVAGLALLRRFTKLH